MQQTTLTTPRLTIRPIRLNDAADLFELVSDRDTCYNDGGYEPFTEMNDSYMKFIESCVPDESRYVIELTESGKAIGMIHLMETTRDISSLSIGYLINKDYRRKGCTHEAVAKMLEYCFDNGIELIEATAFTFNSASIALLKKLGFEQEGIIHKNMNHCKYGYVDSALFYIEKSMLRK